jgi:hypothetical protein
MEALTAYRLKEALSGYRYDLSNEDSIQSGLERAMLMEGLVFVREAQLSNEDRLDFLVDACVAIEVKRQGSLQELLRQLSRYAQHVVVRELLVVTSRLQSTNLPTEIGGKPLECLVLLGSIF